MEMEKYTKIAVVVVLCVLAASAGLFVYLAESPSKEPKGESSTKEPKKTCSEECKERGWDYGICRSWKPTDELWRCKHDELDIGNTPDCYVPSGTVGESKTCCCGGNLEKECAKAGEEISPVEHRKGVKCCEDLVGIVPGRWLYPLGHADCSIIPPYETPHVQCAPCGNGLCETEYGENRCNCPKDCSEEFCGWSTYAKCKTDVDCNMGGCSGEVCEGKGEGTITDCEGRDCYYVAGYECKCVDDKCQWSK